MDAGAQVRATGQESSRDPGLDGLAGRQDSDDPDAAARGAPFAFEEGPHYRTKEPWGAFRMTIQYRALDRRPAIPRPPGTDQGFSSSNEHLESNTTRVFFIVSFPRIDSKPSPSLSRCSRTRYDSRSP